jgi:hypothetical protein
MSTLVKKNIVFKTICDLLYEDFPKLGWITKGISYRQVKTLQNFEANLYISKFEFARQKSIICPNQLIGMVLGLSFSTRNVSAENHLELTNIVAKFCDLLATRRYMNIDGIAKLTVLEDPTILVGQSSSSSTAVTDILYSPILLRVIF